MKVRSLFYLAGVQDLSWRALACRMVAHTRLDGKLHIAVIGGCCPLWHIGTTAYVPSELFISH
jgi:hypothetical protein